MNKIIVTPSPTADTRSCDPTTVTKDQLAASTLQHIEDVRKAMNFFIAYMRKAGECHDDHKLQTLDKFYEAFQGKMKDPSWLMDHYDNTRHHLTGLATPKDDTNLIDVLEYIADCTMASMCRKASDKRYPIELDSATLQQAFANTVQMLADAVVVVSSKDEEN